MVGTTFGRLVDVPELGLRVAAGFEICRFADHGLAPNVYAMTIDPEGRVVVSSRGYIKRLIDSDGDGRADGDVLIRQGGPGAMGMCFIEGGDLLTSEGGRLNRYSDDDGDGRLDAEPALIEQFAGGEHGATRHPQGAGWHDLRDRRERREDHGSACEFARLAGEAAGGRRPVAVHARPGWQRDRLPRVSQSV